MIPTRDIEGVRAAQERLSQTLDGLSDADCRQPSLLPGWTVGHVLTHLARNADSHIRRLEAAARGQVVDQYVGGYEGRAADIEDGAHRSAAELVADVRDTASAFERVCRSVPPATWDRPTKDVGGEVRPANLLPLRRWQEVEVHHADLGLDFSWRDWPDPFVEAYLPHLLAGLNERLPEGTARPDLTGIPEREVMAWLFGRHQRPGLPDLGPWG